MSRFCFLTLFGLLVACGPVDEAVVDVQSTAPVAESGEGKGDSFADDPEAVWESIIARCGAPAADEPVVYQNDFQWGYTVEAMAVRYAEIYASGKRLSERAYYDDDSGQFLLPSTATWGGAVALPPRLVENVTLHIEHALERGYVDFVFFPDMGHSHLFVPQDAWDAHYSSYPVSEIARRYEAMFDDPALMILYHTAEQLEMLDADDKPIDDPHLRWRHSTRNPVGDNNYERRLELLFEDESSANTAHDMPGYKYYGAGFNISASADGCFPFEVNGETQYYDISLSDLPFPPGVGGDF